MATPTKLNLGTLLSALAAILAVVLGAFIRTPACQAASPESNSESAEKIYALLRNFDENRKEILNFVCRLDSELSQPDCIAQFEHFCSNVNSPAHHGNLQIGGADGKKYSIQIGIGPHNLHYGTLLHVRADLAGAKDMPADLRLELERYGYFDKLRELLRLASASDFTLKSKQKIFQILQETRRDIGLAEKNTAIRRIMAKYPNVDIFMPSPHFIEADQRKTEDEVQQEFFAARWKNSQEWLDAKARGESILKSAIDYIEQKKDVDPQQKAMWLKTLRTLKFAAPGSGPETGSTSCADLDLDSQYDWFTNQIVICAGFFGVNDIDGVIAHEISHALAGSRTQELKLLASDFVQDFHQIRGRACANNPISCSEWAAFKDKMPRSLEKIAALRMPNAALYACLANRDQIPEPNAEKLRIATLNNLDALVSDMAGKNDFLLLSHAEIPLPGGSTYTNPNYLNTCGFDDAPEGLSIQAEALVHEFFVQEYRCTDPGQPEADRLEQSLLAAQDLSGKVLTVYHQDKPRRTNALPGWENTLRVEEQAADRMSIDIYLHHMQRTGADADDPQLHFFVSKVDLCPEELPFAQAFPEAAEREARYGGDSHSEGRKRMRELFISPLREHLGCRIKNPVDDCHF